MGDREELVERIVDEWWRARAEGEAVMEASTWRDVLELNEKARDRLVTAGVVEREGLDLRGVTIGVGARVVVLRNDRTLGVINGTLGTITAIDRERGDLLMRTVEPDPRDVRLTASYWNAKGRRRVSLAYWRTIHKAQGATYRGESFTLAGDDTIHLEAVHVALSRGTRANALYYVGDPHPTRTTPQQKSPSRSSRAWWPPPAAPAPSCLPWTFSPIAADDRGAGGNARTPRRGAGERPDLAPSVASHRRCDREQSRRTSRELAENERREFAGSREGSRTRCERPENHGPAAKDRRGGRPV